jgi:hypothetical protein
MFYDWSWHVSLVLMAAKEPLPSVSFDIGLPILDLIALKK